ncbi:MAG: hypothetical protein HY052_08220 [Proteobacteria bacterium]|nr:hypothetical protein [Pseudomonadota bacterium]
MKKFLASFMIVAMLASTMVCGCWHEAAAASHSHHHSGDEHHHDAHDTGFKQDCSGTDLQLPQQVSVNAHNLKNSLHLDHVLADQQLAWTPVLASSSSIRGPPPNWPGLSQTHPSILLTTQRFLI